MKNTFYITTTLPYVNAEPHIGFAMEIVQADSMARAKRLQGDEVFFNTGSDEHGQKIFEAAQKDGRDVQEYVDFYAASFERLKNSLNLSYDKFIRTTDEDHVKAAQEMWNRCKAKGDIYEKEFEGLYCIGCERYLTERDMADGKCLIHGSEPRLMKEKNWFFKLSKYQDDLLKYLSKTSSIIPDWRREEAIAFVKEGLEDFSISREKERLTWGVPVPDDENQVMYVWFDALTNYISTLGWPDGENFKKFWEEGYTVQTAGKDQVRFQSIMWQAMLISAGVKNTDQIFYHGFINSGGQKMSKSLGNVVSPFDMVTKYGTDATRYMFLRHVHATEDTDVTWEKMDEWYNANLANGIGNLVSRIMKLSEDYLSQPATIPEWEDMSGYFALFNELKLNEVTDYIWEKISNLDQLIQEKKPWQSKDSKVIEDMVVKLYSIARMINPIMPEMSAKIKDSIKNNKKPEASLFPRLNSSTGSL